MCTKAGELSKGEGEGEGISRFPLPSPLPVFTSAAQAQETEGLRTRVGWEIDRVATVREKSGNSAKSHRKFYFLSTSVKSQGILCEKILQKLTKEADTLATEAKTKNKIDLLVKSNAMYSKSGEKTERDRK